MEHGEHEPEVRLTEEAARIASELRDIPRDIATELADTKHVMRTLEAALRDGVLSAQMSVERAFTFLREYARHLDAGVEMESLNGMGGIDDHEAAKTEEKISGIGKALAVFREEGRDQTMTVDDLYKELSERNKDLEKDLADVVRDTASRKK